MPPPRQRGRTPETPDTCNRPRSEPIYLARCWRIDAKAASKSWSLATGTSSSCCPIAFAAFYRSRNSSHASWLQAGEQDMTLHLTRMKQEIGRVSEVLGWIVVLSLVLGPWIAWVIGEPYRHYAIRAGELCSHVHRWTYAQPMFTASDLSCLPYPLY